MDGARMLANTKMNFYSPKLLAILFISHYIEPHFQPSRKSKIRGRNVRVMKENGFPTEVSRSALGKRDWF